ncbi:similar to Saccharomyces cerevisiae YNL272C SEC2 Guanyl-nucleotide exchange factor for the small G-protein Sec4p [Maudiozyma barnettii]|uniref:Similar to Saccharomyces cerevisiae YNL272C SEC2 Guanyl-nucleotide exchange factor for the small G-protein Sec4p n=1 Tax=Maudiozyma barnettii TaxID=61262 RepID=A0A8H2VF17_9SACH|nr:guanine nucleotide exchange factor SEC2 [Kazachstania barnettii]CAB4253949.1 similar to Saccharomyces cerevisiae YNL272C SEC2 Guanyl-nucleotide exchange factor for the small G-protein Sec4p [Kazachstania barnettii]CAD1781699.1 similar to Saccharomyces cerevisiae YNL272C SEC2 Guanyl-nucleotide exchange factor for the small G-protein Sec4p [Kazachstania barnettii]
MAEVTEETLRIREQVSSLSTQLMESVDRQSQLEDKLRQANKLLQSQSTSVATLEALQVEHESLKEKMIGKDETIKDLKSNLKSEVELRTKAETEVDKLSQEVEDLTASLFAEANNMVADARREKHTTEILNTKLVEQLRNKDNTLETLNLQLKNLKVVLQNVEKESVSNQSSRYSTILNDSDTTSGRSLNKVTTSSSSITKDSDNVILYSPYVTTIRYDLTLFNEFLKFVAVLPYCKTIRETASESKLLRRLLNDEVQPVLRIDNAPGVGWLAKKTLIQQMIEGLVILEPLSGVNETYQIGYRNADGNTSQPSKLDANSKESHMFNYPVNSPPVAVHGPCAFCGENRDDIIEHARMHVLKVQSKADDGTLTVTSTYSLCYSCVNKVRQTGQIFAFLRSLKLGTWHLEQVTLKTIEKGDWNKMENIQKVGKVTAPLDKKSKRMSFMEGLGISQNKMAAQVETSNAVIERAGFPTTNIQRAWLHLCQLRCMLFWTHIGIWSVDDSITSKIGPVIKSKDETLKTQTPNIIENWKYSQSEESLTSHKEPTSEKDDMFDFESKSDLDQEHQDSKSETLDVNTTENIDTNKGTTFTEEEQDETFTKEGPESSTVEKNTTVTETVESVQIENHDDIKESSENSVTKGLEIDDSQDPATESSKVSTPIANNMKENFGTENPDNHIADVASGDDSIDILNDYTGNEQNREGTSSPSNEDEFDDAQENV